MLPRKCRGVVTGYAMRTGLDVWRALCAQAAPLGTTLGCCLHVPLSPDTLWEALRMIMLIFSLSLEISTNMPFINMQIRC